MNRRKSERPFATPVQRFIIGVFGLATIFCGVGTLFMGQTYLHTIPGSSIGGVFAPFAVVVGTTLIVFAIKLNRPR
jgi:hypothetical protein